MGEGAMESSTTGHTAHAKHVGLLSFAGDVRIRFIPIHLGFFSPTIGLRNKQFLADQPQFRLSLADVATNGALGDLHLRQLRSDPAPDAVGGMPLLPRCLPVCFQNRFDENPRWFQLRALTHGYLAFSGNCPEDCLPDHAPMNPKLPGNSSDRSPTMFVLTSYLLE